MKKAAAVILVIAMTLSALPACASPDCKTETVLISFTPDMRAAVPEPAGRWLDELFTMLTIRAERSVWEDGCLTELFFLLRGEEACSIGLLQLKDEFFACGSLLPEGPVPLSGPQRQIMAPWPANLFAANGEDGRARYAPDARELAGAMRGAADTCMALKVDRDEHGALDAAAVLLGALADAIEERGEGGELLVIEMEDIEPPVGYMGEEIDLDMLDGLAEMILARFAQSMMYALARLDGE